MARSPITAPGRYICVYSAGDAIPLARNPMPSRFEGTIVRGQDWHGARMMPLRWNCRSNRNRRPFSRSGAGLGGGVGRDVADHGQNPPKSAKLIIQPRNCDMPDSISPRPTTDPAQREMILAAVDKFWARCCPLRPRARSERRVPHEIVERMKELGLFGATIGEEWGGLASTSRPIPRLSSGFGGMDVGVGYFQLASDHGRGGRAFWHRGPEKALPAAFRHQ